MDSSPILIIHRRFKVGFAKYIYLFIAALYRFVLLLPLLLHLFAAEATLINFTVTSKGLEDQLLSLVVRMEWLDLALLYENLVKQQHDFTIKVKELEDNILYKLATAQGDITEDVELIEGLENTIRIANEIAIKQVQATNTQAKIKVG